MLYYLLVPLRDQHIFFNLFRYISFRAAASAVTALLISWLIGPFIIKKLKSHQIGEEIRSDGPQTHLSKKGTPSMGGVIILVSVVVPTLLFARILEQFVWIVLLATIWLSLIGILDDYLKIIKKVPKRLVGRYKLAGQITLGLLVGAIIYFFPVVEWARSSTTLPFFKNYELQFGVFYIAVVAFVITAMSNGSNLTDGLDGLLIGQSAIAAVAFAFIAYVSGRVDFSDYLNIIYLPGAGELAIFCAALFGASLGFLYFNCYPAEVFMGDTGALALGGAIGTVAVLVKKAAFSWSKAFRSLFRFLFSREREKEFLKWRPFTTISNCLAGTNQRWLCAFGSPESCWPCFRLRHLRSDRCDEKGSFITYSTSRYLAAPDRPCPDDYRNSRDVFCQLLHGGDERK